MKLKYKSLNYKVSDVVSRYLSIQYDVYLNKFVPQITEINNKGFIIRSYFLTTDIEYALMQSYIGEAEKIRFLFPNKVEVPLEAML